MANKKACTQAIVDEAMRITSKDVRALSFYQQSMVILMNLMYQDLTGYVK